MSAIEGSYSVHYARGVIGWDHPDLPALHLASAVLNAAESYLWKSIRGSGLAYGARIETDPESGLVGFSVYRVSAYTSTRSITDKDQSPNAMLAYEAGGKLLAGLADGTVCAIPLLIWRTLSFWVQVELEQNIIDSARSSLTYSYARKSETVMGAVSP